jgi:hypothetical protein
MIVRGMIDAGITLFIWNFIWDQRWRMVNAGTIDRGSIVYVACAKSSCSGLVEEWDVKWWHTPPAKFTQHDPVDVQ